MMMTREELEQWLGEAGEESVGIGEIAEVLHMVVDASRRALAIADAGELREMRFALAVLRDVFPDDADVRSWLRAPSLDMDGIAPAELVAAGRIRDFADLAVAEWNGPRRATVYMAPVFAGRPLASR
jgi:hypothetical protein